MTVVSGRVTNPDGTGVAGVWVYALPRGGGRFGQAPGVHTTTAGRWSLELAPGEWTVRETGGGGHEVLVGTTPISLDSPPPALSALSSSAPRRGLTKTSSQGSGPDDDPRAERIRRTKARLRPVEPAGETPDPANIDVRRLLRRRATPKEQ